LRDISRVSLPGLDGVPATTVHVAYLWQKFGSTNLSEAPGWCPEEVKDGGLMTPTSRNDWTSVVN